MKKYAVLCTNRSGSSFLCEALTSTNRCGKPQEFFNPWIKEQLAEEFSYHKGKGIFPEDEKGRPILFDRVKYKEKIIKDFRTKNDVFGIKVVGFWQLMDFASSKPQNDWKYIYLYREDKVLQAISAYIADKTNGWHKETTPPEYDKDAIKWYYDMILKDEEVILEYLQDKNYLSLSYENDLCESLEQTVTSILNYLDISTEELPEIKISNKYRKPKEPNLTWKKKFLEENPVI